MNKNTISTLFQISLLFMMVMAPLAAANTPDYPMILHGTVVDIDSGGNAPEGTIVMAKDSETGKEIGMTTVGENGIYGDAINNKLLVNKCESFDLIVVLEGNEVKVDTITWKEGPAADPINVWYSKDTTTGDSSDSGTGSSSRYRAGISNDQSTETAVAGGAGLDTSSESPTTDTTTLSEAVSSQSTNKGKSSLPLIIALFAIIAIIAYLGYQKLY